MSVLHLLGTAGDGGAETYFVDLVAALARSGVEEACAIRPHAGAPAEPEPVSRASLDTPEDAPLLLGMGRLHDSKAHDVSLQALTQVPGAYLWIAGAGPLEAKLRSLAQALGVADRVRFL